MSFKVLIRDRSVIAVTLVLEEGNNIPNEFVMECKPHQQNHFKNNWTLASYQCTLPVEVDYRYHYVVTAKTPAYNIIHDTEDLHGAIKSFNAPSQFNDVFENPRYNNISKKVQFASEAAFLYIGMFLPRVSSPSLKDSIIQTETAGFPGLHNDKQFITTITEWLNKVILPNGATTTPLSDPQIKFLAVVLGKLVSNTFEMNNKCLSIPVIKEIITVLRKSTLDEFPLSVHGDLKTTCLWLITAAAGTWLYFWQCFYKLFDLDYLVKQRRSLAAPMWMVQTWQTTDKEVLESCVSQFSNDAKILEQLIICSLEDCSDTRVLKWILDLYYTSPQSKSDDNVVSVAVTQLEDIIKIRFTRNLTRLVDISKNISSTYSQLGEVVRHYVVNYLSKEMWERDQMDAVREVIRDDGLYQTSKELTEVIRHMLKQPDGFHVNNIFIDIISNPKIMKWADKARTPEILEMGIRSLVSSCRLPRKRDDALRSIYRILALIRECNHLNRFEPLQEYMEALVYTLVKDIPLDCFFRSLSPDADQELGHTELPILASHILRRFEEGKCSSLDNATERTNHLKQLQDSEGHLQVTSSPMRDVLLAMIDLQEQSIPVDQYSLSGKASVKFEACILKMIKDSDFWIMLFEAKGEYSEALKQHQSIKMVSDALQHLAKLMLDGEITIHFVATLKKATPFTTIT